MLLLKDTLGGKQPGDLIRSKEWDALIDAVDQLRSDLGTLTTSVDNRLNAVDQQLSALQTTATTLQGKIDALGTTLQNLEARFHPVTLQADRSSYAMGELATLVARVSDVAGNPLDLTNAANRPWIDFVATWGRLKAVPGFASLGGAEDRAISVQVNDRGEAHVFLRAENAEGFTDQVEEEVATSLTTGITATNRSFAETILTAATPLEAQNHGAFDVMVQAYDGPNASVRNYMDTYFVKNPELVYGTFPPISFTDWRDYRATVLALVRPDSDATTPDSSLGAASLQVTFRDWISPWINIGYLPTAERRVPVIRQILAAQIGRNVPDSIRHVQGEIDQLVSSKGVLGRQRDYAAVQSALDSLTLSTQPPPFLPDLALSLGDAVRIQQTLDPAASTAGKTGHVAFQVFSNTTARIDVATTGVKNELTDFAQQQITQAKQDLEAQVDQQQQRFRQDLLKEDGPILSVQKKFAELDGKVGGVQEALHEKADIKLLERVFRPNG